MDAFLIGLYILVFPGITLLVLIAIWRQVWRDARQEKKDIV